jgi:hypothetical protein
MSDFPSSKGFSVGSDIFVEAGPISWTVYRRKLRHVRESGKRGGKFLYDLNGEPVMKTGWAVAGYYGLLTGALRKVCEITALSVAEGGPIELRAFAEAYEESLGALKASFVSRVEAEVLRGNSE